ncbi:extracellular solute-binding protein [Halalkalicoccus sp. NIPERK01]|uniref:extracellular solute-binding protein n=1 Tax=Halalkalicoccus sp. NIPERK01 TaxID=3053469 RepID=UPI00256EBA1D|nr:extracellular solute-binding protein [Halalkalicoccus sp. NIPERK01]MDL5362457.1 extracellular solute-binding protein [Halalkalicoccus sp. NIPERK01]
MVDNTRRAVLRVGVGLGGVGLAGCTGRFTGQTDGGTLGNPEFAEGRPDPDGPTMDDLPDLGGEVTVYSGRSEQRVGELIDHIEDRYDDLTVDVRYADSADLVNAILTEEGTPADIYYTTESGTLTFLKEEGYTETMPEDVLELCPEEFRDPDDQWMGLTRRSWAVAFNTDRFEASDIPEGIMEFPESEVAGEMGWAPFRGSTQAFVTAMRVIHGEEETREWIEGMLDAGLRTYEGGRSDLAQATGSGEIGASLYNHYIVRGNLDMPIDVTYTRNDAGVVPIVPGACVMDASDDHETAVNFIGHWASAEAQEYFATTTWEYPVSPHVEPLDVLPDRDELEPPEIDLNDLADIETTLELLRDLDVL